MIIEYLTALGFIFIAEMGDKTQLLAMAFATKYKLKYVVTGILIGSLFNHAIAVILGSNLQHIIPLNNLSIIAGFSFVLFGLWSLKLDEDEDTNTNFKRGPIVTVSLAFFIGELGDKTQLTAIALSSDASFPFFILLGTVSGMVITGLLGIFVGIKLGNKVDEFVIKVASGIVFIIFGYIKLFNSLDDSYINATSISLFTITIVTFAYILLLPTLKLRRIGYISSYRKVAQKLQDYYSDMYNQIDDICLGENHCGTCGGNKCLVGYTKNILLRAKKQGDILAPVDKDFLQKDFPRKKVLTALIETILFLEEEYENPSYQEVHKIRNNLEIMLYSSKIKAESYSDYLDELRRIDRKLYDTIQKNKA